MAIQIQLRRGTASQWTTANTLLAQGELGLETDTNKFKFGDGVTTWNSLPYYANGSVTSVALSGGTTGLTVTGSPITTSGTITLGGTLDVDNGGTGQTSYTDGQLLIGNTTGNTLTKTTLTAGSGIAITNGSGSISIAATNSGTVTAVTGTSPVVSSGGATPAISLASGYGDTQNPYASKTANYVLAAPDGVSGVPTFRAVVAADIPTLNQNTTGNAANVTGTVAVANGGTGSTTASGARTNLSAASSGSNTDITSIALTTGTVSTSPSSSTDIVNKSYADSIASGVNFHGACNYATTAALAANTYNNGSSGVGATLTAVAVGTLTIDGYTLVIGDVGKRLLIKNEVAQANNGIYILTQAGTALLPYILTRATDYDTSGSGTNEVDQGDMMLVLSGTTNGNTSWVQQTALPITIGTTALVFLQFAAIQTYTAGTGLSLTTNQFSITNVGTANTYGSSTTIPVLTTNAQGQVTAVTNTAIGTLNQNTTGSAATLTTGRTLAITGDLAYTSPSFDGSTNVTAAGTLATVNTNVGSFTNATLTVNGKGLITAASSGTAPVTSVTATSPVASTGGTTPVISMPAATTSVSGYLTSTDWTTFNNKGSGTVTSVGGTGTVNGITLTGTVTSSGNLTLGGTLSNVDLATQVTGNLPVTNLNGGTSASASTFWRGDGSWAAPTGGSGTVTSVAATVPSFLSVTGSPITTSGTLAIALASTPTNGQLLIGNGTGFSYATLTAGSNITITNSSGGITIASSGGGGTSSPIPKLQSWSIGGF